jgi:Putative adhesin
MPTQTFETPGHVRLNLSIPSGRIEIETAPVQTTEVELEALSDAARELLGDTRIASRERPGGHEVIVEVPQRTSFFLGFGRGAEFRLRVSCPDGADLEARTKTADVLARGRYGAVELKTASGDVNVDEAQELRAKTASGDVALDTVHGPTNVQTASGDLAIQRAGGDVTAQIVSGDVWIRDAGASVHAHTVSGDQRLDAVMAGAVEAHTVSGDVLVGVRRGSRVYVDATTVSGSTTSELDLSEAPEDNGGATEGEEAPMVELRLKTVSGDVSIVRAAAPVRTQ